jgi:hypothetical protein
MTRGLALAALLAACRRPDADAPPPPAAGWTPVVQFPQPAAPAPPPAHAGFVECRELYQHVGQVVRTRAALISGERMHDHAGRVAAHALRWSCPRCLAGECGGIVRVLGPLGEGLKEVWSGRGFEFEGRVDSWSYAGGVILVDATALAFHGERPPPSRAASAGGGGGGYGYGGGGRVQVRGYHRRDGTYVRGYSRRR